MTKTEILFEYDRKEAQELILAGTDEAGRGPLAGPVSASVVIMPLGDGDMLDGINDSKKISERKREQLYEEIKRRAIAYSVVLISPQKIDEINILEATKLAMRTAYNELGVKPDVIIADAINPGFPCETRSIVKGDATSYNVAAASILAKVERDRYMAVLDEKYPEYGFAKHKGYGTAVHIEAIKRVGPCPEHRRSFIGKIMGEK